jgi:signal transduction histidine kinase
MVEVVIADEGPGWLPKEIATHLFEAFQSTKRDGMGLGLAICRSITEAHGGNLRYEPNPGGGTIFRFTLPVAATAARLDVLPFSRKRSLGSALHASAGKVF